MDIPSPLISPATLADVDTLRELWLELHHHEQSVVDFQLQPDDDISWSVRAAQYRRLIVDGTGFVRLAVIDNETVGYIAVALHAGAPDDTFDLGSHYAEIRTLAVTAAERSRGIGTLLFRSVESELAGRGVTDINIAVMTSNTAAIRFYERQGLRPVEVDLWKITRPTASHQAPHAPDDRDCE